jgi:hypothetical protein
VICMTVHIIPATVEQADSAPIFYAFTVPNPNEVLRDERKWSEMTQEQRQESNRRYSELSVDNRDYERHDPNLIQVVEELGKAASGSCANIQIVEIPDGVEYVVSEYDGNEHIAEAHRTWY